MEKINQALSDAANGAMKGVLLVEDAPLVSSDFIGSPYSSIVDSQSTMVMGPNFAKVFSWYDNEMGFSTRMVDLALYMVKQPNILILVNIFGCKIDLSL